MTNCGASESCCTSIDVPGGTYYRTYNKGLSWSDPRDGGDWPDLDDPATVSSFRLDKYLVTVGRFRQFVAAWNDGWVPAAGSGKHTHLNGGQGVANTAGGYESGWDATAWDNAPNINPTDAKLGSCAPYSTWTATASTQENLPIDCVTWYEAYAFCIWDGGFLPSEAEWEYAAAGGSEQRQFPWGSAVPGSACPGTGCDYAIYSCYYPNGPVPNCTGVSNIAPVGSASAGAGLWGQLDLGGDMWEWNLDWYASPYVDPCVDCANLLPGSSTRVMRGGYFDEFAALYMFPPNRNNFYHTDRYDIGFRCARTP
jgi:formylglycine-generating enzyme required for sulfatase activity